MRYWYSILLLAIAGAHTAAAAEIVVRAECAAAGPLVTLGQFATVHSTNPVEVSELSAMDLMASPVPGEQRTLRVRELQDMLATRGVNLATIRFSGASQVSIRAPQAELPAKPPTKEFKPATAKISVRNVAEQLQFAISAYLQQQTEQEGWNVSVKLNDGLAGEITQLGAYAIQGGEEPWTGKQTFVACGNEDQTVEIEATVEMPPSVVVARNPLARGLIVRAEDLQLQPGKATKGEAVVFQSIEEVVGKEVVRNIGEGQILDDKSVRRPLLVHRNEVVTVYARAEGIKVRITARSREDGGAGDLVTVETIEERKTFLARVSGPQQVEVFAQSTTVGEPVAKPVGALIAPAPLGKTRLTSEESQ